MCENKVSQTAIFLGGPQRASWSIGVWRPLVAERWPWTTRRGGTAGMNSDDRVCPLGAQQCSGSLGARSQPWAVQRTAHQEAFPASLDTSQASNSRDAPLETHCQQAELWEHTASERIPKALNYLFTEAFVIDEAPGAFLFPTPSLPLSTVGSGWYWVTLESTFPRCLDLAIDGADCF